MESTILQSLFLVLTAALIGGTLARLLNFPVLIGYILIGFLGSLVLPINIEDVEGLAEIGIVLLLFSVGLELSLSKLSKVGQVAIIGASFQMIIVALLSYQFLLLWGIEGSSALVLSLGFSLSSTAVVVKMLADRGETDAIHGDIMIGWLLTQDLAVIPMIALLPLIGTSGVDFAGVAGNSIITSGFIVAAVFFLGRMVAPFLTHAFAASNSRELLVLGGVSLALGTAYLVSLFGVSPALGAFLAGVVISETQENHAIFAETRPLRDIFVILFFVTLGFFVTPSVLFANFGMIITLAVFVMLLKIIVVFSLVQILGYKGKTAIAVSLGLAQIGEFSFVIFIAARELGLLDSETASIGVATVLITLVATPILFRSIVPVWRKLKNLTAKVPRLHGLFTATVHHKEKHVSIYKKHIIICGYGRMGKWIGRALDTARIPYVVIEYNQKVVHNARLAGVPIIYGDPAEKRVMDAAGVKDARVVVVAVPDRITQEEVISYTQTAAPKALIYARAHLDEDVATLSSLNVSKVVQPEFEGGLSIIRNIFTTMGRPKTEIAERLKSLRRSHTLDL